MKLSFNRPADLLETFEQEDEFNFYWYSDQLVTYSYNTDTLLIGILV